MLKVPTRESGHFFLLYFGNLQTTLYISIARNKDIGLHPPLCYPSLYAPPSITAYSDPPYNHTLYGVAVG